MVLILPLNYHAFNVFSALLKTFFGYENIFINRTENNENSVLFCFKCQRKQKIAHLFIADV